MSNDAPVHVVHESENGIRIQLLGDVGIEQIADFHSVLLRALDEHTDQQLVIDCAEVTSLDLAAIQVLLSAANQPGTRLEVDPGTQGSPAWDSLTASGLDRIIPLAGNLSAQPSVAVTL